MKRRGSSFSVPVKRLYAAFKMRIFWSYVPRLFGLPVTRRAKRRVRVADQKMWVCGGGRMTVSMVTKRWLTCLKPNVQIYLQASQYFMPVAVTFFSLQSWQRGSSATIARTALRPPPAAGLGKGVVLASCFTLIGVAVGCMAKICR